MQDGVFDVDALRAITAMDDDDDDEDGECDEGDEGGEGVAPMTGGQTRMGATFIDPKASAEQIVKAFIELFKKVFNL